MSRFKQTATFLETIKFSHTVFALPFAFVPFVLNFRFLQTQDRSILVIALWILLCMIGARTGAMGFNRLVDRKWDKANPRTATRPSVSGAVSPQYLLFACLLSFSLFVFAASQLNQLAFYLSPVAIFFLCFYSYTKRFTWLCHWFLGFSIALAPVGAWIAIRSSVNLVALLLFVSLFAWISAFDLLYALQDMQFDSKAGLRSFPVFLGMQNTLRVSRFFYVITMLAWLAIGVLAKLHFLYYLVVALLCALLIYQQWLVAKQGIQKVNFVFWNLNSWVGSIYLIAIIIGSYSFSF